MARGNWHRLLWCLPCHLNRDETTPDQDVVAWFFDPGAA